MSLTSSRALFKGRHFTPIFVAQFGGAFNDNLLKFTLIMLVTYNPAYTQSLQQLLGMESTTLAQQINLVASALFIVPFFIFSAVAGSMADRYAKHTFIRQTKLAELLIMLIVVAGLSYESIYLLLTALFLMGVQSAFFGPLKYGALPELLPANKIAPATGFMQGATFVAILAGTAAGGFLTKSDHSVFYNSLMITSIAAAGYIAACFIPKLAPAAEHPRTGWSPLGEFKETIGYAFTHRKLALGVVGLSWFWLLGSMILALLPPFVKTQMFADESVATSLIICAAICVALGAVACGQLVKDARKTGLAGVGVGASLAMLALLPALPHSAELYNFATLPVEAGLYFAAIVIFSISCGFFTVPLFATLQLAADPTKKARTIAANNIVNALFMVVGAVLTSLLIGMFALSPGEVFALLGVITVLLGLYYKRAFAE